MATLPAGFEECYEGKCPKAKEPVENEDSINDDTYTVEMDGKPDKCWGQCRCYLFSAEKKAKHGKEDWNLEPDPQKVKDADSKKFKFICVQPSFEEVVVLCVSAGKCPEVTEKKQDDAVFVRCEEGDGCKGKCKCVLFELDISDRDARWQKVTGFPHKRQKDRIYRCFCVEP